jgi:hypothetical protein
MTFSVVRFRGSEVAIIRTRVQQAKAILATAPSAGDERNCVYTAMMTQLAAMPSSRHTQYNAL